MKYNVFGKPKPYWVEGYTPYTPCTPNDVLPPPTFNLELKVGDKWYVKYPQDYEVSKVEIIELTEKTVRFKIAEDGPTYPVRYKKLDVEFVEKVQ